MTALELHGFSMSPPSRAVHMTLDLLGLEYTFVNVNVIAGGTRTPEYLSLNPQHTVPVLVDGKLVITESRAAITYLVSEYKPGELYPEEPAKRSAIDQRMYFNIGIFYKRLGDCIFPICYGKSKTIAEVDIDALKEALQWVDDFMIEGYVLGSSMTIADVDFISTVSTLEACNFVDLSQYKNIKKWSKSIKQSIPKYYENCGKGAETFGKWFNSNYSRKEKIKQKITNSLSNVRCF